MKFKQEKWRDKNVLGKMVVWINQSDDNEKYNMFYIMGFQEVFSNSFANFATASSGRGIEGTPFT